MRRANTTDNTFSRRAGFTLVELLVVIAIIGILASLFLAGLYAAEETAKIQSTKATIAKINNVIMARWEGYRTRRVPINVSVSAGAANDAGLKTGVSLATAAGWRLDTLREIMRFEMPNTWTDVMTPPDNSPPDGRPPLGAVPSVGCTYQNKYNFLNSTSYRINVPLANQATMDQYDAAETLYMICMLGSPDEVDPRNNFTPREIGDVDRDGAAEFLDAWGTPIIFIRWAPGFVGTTPTGYFTSELQTGLDPDPFDPFHVYPSVDGSPGQSSFQGTALDPMRTFALYPLIMSAGPDKAYDIVAPNDAPNFTDTMIPGSTYQINDPFYSLSFPVTATNGPVGTLCDTNKNGILEYYDNIHNHMLGTK